MKRMACVLALAASASLSGAVVAPALAEKVVTTTGSGLQLTLTAAGNVPADSALALDVRFEGGSLRMVELLVDGVSVKKKSVVTRNTRGKLEFEIGANYFSEGTHDIVIKAEDSNGNVATTTTQIKVTSGANGLVKFMALKNKGMVQGVVPVEVKIDPSIRNPYVSFFVDDTFLALTNYAPFTVNWDSTKATNGLHTVTVEVYDNESLAKIKTTSIQLMVNNPGGLTNRQNETADLANTPKVGGAHPVVNSIATAVDAGRYASAPKSALEAPGNPEFSARLSGGPVASGVLRSSVPALPAPAKLDVTVNPGNKATALAPANPGFVAIPRVNISPIANGDRNNSGAEMTRVKVNKPGILGIFADPHGLASLSSSNTSVRLAHSITPRRAGNMAARPSMSMDNRNAEELAPARVTTVKPIQIANAGGTLPGFGGSHRIQVAFDNTRIAFDVQPRIENGMPLAPFRQIFEHAGGSIKWYNQSKTLRAVNATREIELHVGDDEAKVNNETVKMETRTFIEKGRTIVPLSFVRDALDVNVTYDAATGHIRIESKK